LKLRSYIVLLSLIAVLLLIWGGVQLRDKVLRDTLRAQEYAPAPPGMVFVPAGEFLMGSDDPNAEPDEKPLRKVFVPAFYIDQFEVTNRRYKEFKQDHRYPPGEADLPVTFVLKRDAEAFCRWAGRRLPTNAEWEKAARGTDGRVYPWGDEFKPDCANIRRRTNPALTNAPACKSPLAPLAPSRGKLVGGSFPKGASPYGCQDMAGNVWEWVSDVWRDPSWFGGKSAGDARGILRGGASSYSPLQARTSYQGFEALDATCHDVGFRCAMDAVARRSPKTSPRKRRSCRAIARS
jgi:formylglycine-generating enzyme required for sulfatase activity